jgi:hypothetical protein
MRPSIDFHFFIIRPGISASGQFTSGARVPGRAAITLSPITRAFQLLLPVPSLGVVWRFWQQVLIDSSYLLGR